MSSAASTTRGAGSGASPECASNSDSRADHLSSATPLVAALYVEKDGAYFGLPGVDPWDEERDARLYDGPWPVVAHPPCARWCQLASLVEAKLGDGYRVGDDGGTFEAALEAVRRFGGVLEHPALSLAWYRYGLPVPGQGGYTSAIGDPGVATEIAQSAYGHPCRKRTWLYIVGVSQLPELRWTEPPVNGMVSNFDYGRAKRLGIKTYPRGLSNPTPAAFRDVLLNMARSASECATPSCAD